MFKRWFAMISLVFAFSGVVFAAGDWPATQESSAFKKYSARSKTELSKLIFLMDRFNAPGVEIKLDGNLYTSEKAFPYSKDYLAKNYHNEKAENWIRRHCYRSTGKQEVMYLRIPGLDFKPVRDVLIDELKQLEKKK